MIPCAKRTCKNDSQWTKGEPERTKSDPKGSNKDPKGTKSDDKTAMVKNIQGFILKMMVREKIIT